VHDTRRTRLVLSVLLIVAIALITIDFRDGGSSPLHSVGASVFGPVEGAANAVAAPADAMFNSVTGGPSATSRIAALQRENSRLQAELSGAQLSQAALSQLSGLLQLAGRGTYKIVPASVIAVGQDYADTVTLDAGSRDGIKAEETVLNGVGLVGTVTQVSADTSTVLLATDASSIVGVRMAGTSQIGSVTGTGKSMSGSGLLRLRLFDANVVLQPGQKLVTFGSVGDQPFVPGVPIGEVTEVQGNAGSLTQNALVKPFVDFTTLGVVGVVVAAPHTDPRDSVLPSKPKPAPTVTVTVTPGATPSPRKTR
jgi:rod shape-determining protein MreC